MLLWGNLDLKEIDIPRCSNDWKLFSNFGIGCSFRGSYGGVWTCLSVGSKWWRYKPIMCEFEMDFKKYFFVGALSPSKDDLISVFVNMYVAFCDRLQVWKLVWILDVRAENGCGKWHLLVWNRARIWRTGPHIPPNPRFLGVQPPPPTPRCYWHFFGGWGG